MKVYLLLLNHSRLLLVSNQLGNTIGCKRTKVTSEGEHHILYVSKVIFEIETILLLAILYTRHNMIYNYLVTWKEIIKEEIPRKGGL